MGPIPRSCTSIPGQEAHFSFHHSKYKRVRHDVGPLELKNARLLCRHVKRNRQAFEAEEEASLEQFGRVIVYYPQIGQLLENHRQCDCRLHTRKGRTDAEMNAMP